MAWLGRAVASLTRTNTTIVFCSLYSDPKGTAFPAASITRSWAASCSSTGSSSACCCQDLWLLLIICLVTGGGQSAMLAPLAGLFRLAGGERNGGGGASMHLTSCHVFGTRFRDSARAIGRGSALPSLQSDSEMVSANRSRGRGC